MTIHEANQRLLFELYHMYDNTEASNIADLVMEKLTGWKRIDRVINKQVKLSEPMQKLLVAYIEKLSQYHPVQYVLEEAWFYGMKFFVNGNVLIPRPETEELVEWIISTEKNEKAIKMLDIGTGSGCIPVVLKKKLPRCEIVACDISAAALEVADINARLHQADIRLIELDILDKQQWSRLEKFKVIVSNPPYIPIQEKPEMDKHVVHHEPHLALFVQDDDPLLFYRTIAEFGLEKLEADGNIFVEVYEEFAEQTAEIFKAYKKVEIKKDMQDKPRMLRVCR